LHVYGQPFQHSDCFIIGTVEDLRELADALLKACDVHMGSGKEKVNFFTSDGEGYSLRIARASEPELDATRLPYYDEMSADFRKGVKDPWEHFIRIL